MSKNYDNWERLVNAVLHQERDKQLALNHSRDSSSIGSQSFTTSSFSYSSSSSQFDHDIEHDQYSLVHRQITSEVPMDYSDLKLSHSEWKAMLPLGKHEVAFRSASLSFFLDPRTRKNCFLLGAMKLVLSGKLVWSEEEDIFHHWERKSHPKSRFPEVAELVDSFRFYIRGEIHEEMLSPETSYTAYVVFGFPDNCKNLESANAIVTISKGGDSAKWQTRVVHFQSGYHRADGWMEVEIGSVYVREGKNGVIKAWLLGTNGYMERKNRLIVEGIEFRPRDKGIFSRFRISKKA